MSHDGYEGRMTTCEAPRRREGVCEGDRPNYCPHFRRWQCRDAWGACLWMEDRVKPRPKPACYLMEELFPTIYPRCARSP